MRLWSLHPRYLDAKGLTAVWREALLAQKALSGMIEGYRYHPQLDRFKRQRDPLASIGAYLRGIQEEAHRRGYRFDAGKIASCAAAPRIPVSRGQLRYELAHLRSKLTSRDPAACRQIEFLTEPEPHPLFCVVNGDVEAWEIRPPQEERG